MMNGGLNNTDAESMGIRFLSRAMDNAQFIADDHTATALVNETSRAAVTAGVQNTALRVADAGVDQLTHHLSLSFFGQENNIHKDGVDVWATPMYGNTNTRGMSASGASVRGNYGGLILGADTEIGEIPRRQGARRRGRQRRRRQVRKRRYGKFREQFLQLRRLQPLRRMETRRLQPHLQRGLLHRALTT